MPESRLKFTVGLRCAISPGERILRAGIALFVIAFVLSTLDNLWYAIPASICAAFLVFGAITGWCPTNVMIVGRAESAEPNTLGYAEALQKIDV